MNGVIVGSPAPSTRLPNTRASKKGPHMLTHPTQDRLVALGLTGMAKALDEQRRQPDVAAPGLRGAARPARRPGSDRAREQAARQPIEVRRAPAERGGRGSRHEGRARARQGAVRQARRRRLDRTPRQNLIIVGKTGLGKSWLACALGHKACRDDRSVLYHRVPTAVRCSRTRSWRRSPRQAAEDPRTRRTPDPRRLGARQRDGRPGPRSPGDPRRPARARIDDRDEPGRREALARR